MSIPRDVKAGWEHRFPELPSPWTHWRIMGDSRLLADVPGERLVDALRVVESNFGRFISIKASRIALDTSGCCVRADDALFEISRHAIDSVSWPGNT